MTEKELFDLIQNAGISFDGCYLNGERAELTITGDWKHDHAYADWLMSKCGYKLVETNEQEDATEDWGSYTHFYQKEETDDEYDKKHKLLVKAVIGSAMNGLGHADYKSEDGELYGSMYADGFVCMNCVNMNCNILSNDTLEKIIYGVS